MDYFKVVDYFFTDYHWNLHHLENSLQFAGDKKCDLFTGIDVYGRGAFEGG